MRTTLVAGIVLLVLVGGTIMGIASIFLLPLVGIIAAVVILLWFLRRRAEHKPPIH
jgi:Na+-driven multidrug efflux pump